MSEKIKDTTKYGADRLNQLMSSPFNGNLIPQPISYLDFDNSIVDFIKNDVKININGDEIKTPVYFFSQQQLNEITSTWEKLDENGVVVPNFFIVSREPNPQPKEFYNIPGEPLFNIFNTEGLENGKKVITSYNIKQPYNVEFVYNIIFVSNKLYYLNLVNSKVIDLFKSRQKYVTVKNLYMPLILENISDNSQYEIEQRKIFIQTYELKCDGYIINEDDIVIKKELNSQIVDFGIQTNKNFLEKINNTTYQIVFPRKKKGIIKFKSLYDINITNINVENILNYSLYVNSEKITSNIFNINKFDNISIIIDRENYNDSSKLTLFTN